VRLSENQTEVTETADSLVFSMTHRNLEGWINNVATRLNEGKVDDRTLEYETMVIDGIAGLLLALQDEQPNDDPFEEPENGGGGGGGEQPGGEGQPQPLIPPIAELKALRALQQQVLNATKRLDAARAGLNETDLGERIDAISSMQADLHAVGSALLTQLQPVEAGQESDK